MLHHFIVEKYTRALSIIIKLKSQKFGASEQLGAVLPVVSSGPTQNPYC